MDTNSRRESSKNTKACLTNHLEDIRLEDNNKIEEVFPWLPKFTKYIHSCAGSRSYQHLEQLLLLYNQNILSSLAGNTVKFSDEINLRNHINRMLIFFHLYWLDIKQDIADHSNYLNKISVLLNVYINMELKTSMEETSSHVVKDFSEKIAAKILAALYIYLNNSEEHIFRVLLRIKHTTEKYTKICNHIFTKSFTNLKTKTTSITDVAYIRYLLAFKMWRKMEETTKKNLFLKKKLFFKKNYSILSDKEKKIDKLAVMLLGPHIPKLRDELLKFVPRPPISQENETLWLIQSNLFDIEVHEQFLLFEEKMINSTNLQCTKTIHADQNCSKSQKQMNSLFRRSNSNGDTSEQKINKCLDSLQNDNTQPNNENNNNETLDLSCLQKKESKSLKSSKKKRKTIIIDLTGDKEISIPYKVKRTKRNSECLKVMKNIMKNKNHINSSKFSSNLMNVDVKDCSNEDNKDLGEKIRLEWKPVYVIKISSNTCPEFAKEDEKQHDYNMHYLKSPMFVNQNIKEFKVTANVSKKNKLENCVSYVTIGNVTNSYDNSLTQNKDTLTSQEESAMETIPLFKTCQNNIAEHSFKQELPTSTNCTMQKSYKYCNTMHDIDHLIISNLESITDRSSQITKMIKEKVCHQVNECPNCYTKFDCKPLFTNKDITAAKPQSSLHNTFNDNENDIKLACDTNIIYTRNDCNKYVCFMNHIDERVMTVHAEKRVQRLDKSNDKCTVSTMFTEDEITEEPSSYNQHVNFDNIRMNDYNAAKYSETMIKEQQKRSDCDRLHSSESSTFDINSFNIGSNAEVDYNLKGFPKIEETNEITNNYVDDLEYNFLNNVQSETRGFLENFFWQSSEQSEINYDNLTDVPTDVPTKKSLMYTDYNLPIIEAKDTLHNLFNNDENDAKGFYDKNIYMSDRDECIYVKNHTGEQIVTTNTEKRMQYLNNSKDICTVSITGSSTEDQVVESLDDQHANSDNRRKYDYEDSSKYFKDTMKEQQRRSDCDISNGQLHSSKLCTFDFLDSKEASEINDFENISFLYTETLEDILSNDTTNFLSLKEQFELDNTYIDTSLNKKNVCNNQNDAVDSRIDLAASHLNIDNTFLFASKV